jgi:aminoglycoside 6-adenylyltransferase
MRSEQEMMDLILGTAKEDDRIRAVIMNGSRANPSAKKDFFQDYDIVYIVTNVRSFTCNHSWINRFGEMMIMQMPEIMGDQEDDKDDVSDGKRFAYLMQFMDGNRIDLTLVSTELANVSRDSQSILLLDKDNVIKPFPPASDADYIIKQPTEKQFQDCCNEFWWVSPYVAKGIWRDELPYAMHMYHGPVRDMLHRMISWYIGVKTDFIVSSGKSGKYFKDYLDAELWAMYKKSYSDGCYENMWDSFFSACDLFRTAAESVAAYFGFEYPYGDDERVTAHLKLVKDLPRSADTAY